MDIVEANPEHPFTVTELAAAAGVGVRALQEAFRRYRGTTPMRFVRDVRLRKAHEELASGTPATVAEVAYRWGFGNLGRFANSYREKYGRPPSLTLRR
ncbi:helix-turn-helix domain-containing protein [Paenarthrobacter sp. NPDC056912]|uniref:helix-turn-helix domain-containing protein n=1 Tax=Paenarthrobacter sp. NPDC056912 TaxID=3345965 RepID=UPI00366D07FD